MNIRTPALLSTGCLVLLLSGCSPVMVAALPSVVASVGPYLSPDAEPSADAWKVQPAAGPAAGGDTEDPNAWSAEPPVAAAAPVNHDIGAASCRAVLDEAARGGQGVVLDALPGFAIRHGGAVSCATDRPCRLDLAQRREPTVTRSTISTRSVASAYRSGVEPMPNAARRMAERKVAQAKRAVDEQSHVMRTGDPGLDLIGLVVGGAIASVVQSTEDRAYESAVAELKATPETIDQARYADYTYVETIVEARKATSWSVTLTDSRTGERWQGDLDWQAWQRFTLGDGVHRDDRGHPGGDGLATPAAIARWEREPSLPPVAAVDAVLVAVGAPGHTTSNATTTDVKLVHVQGTGGTAFGFYVAPNIVATRHAALGRSGVPVVRDAEGRAMPGLLLRADVRHGLALLQVPQAGAPLDIAPGGADPALTPTSGGLASGQAGQPILNGRTVLGIVAENGTVQGTGALRTLLGT